MLFVKKKNKKKFFFLQWWSGGSSIHGGAVHNWFAQRCPPFICETAGSSAQVNISASNVGYSFKKTQSIVCVPPPMISPWQYDMILNHSNLPLYVYFFKFQNGSLSVFAVLLVIYSIFHQFSFSNFLGYFWGQYFSKGVSSGNVLLVFFMCFIKY